MNMQKIENHSTTFKDRALAKKPLKKAFIVVGALLVMGVLCSTFLCASKAFSTNDKYAEHVQGEVLVWLASDSKPTDEQAYNYQQNNGSNLYADINAQVDNFLSQYNCETLACYASDDETLNAVSNNSSYITVKNPSATASASNNLNSKIPLQERVVTVHFDETQKSMESTIAELKSNPLVKYAEPNYIASASSISELTDLQYAYDDENSTSTTHNKAGMNVENWNTTTDNIPESSTTTADEKVVAAVLDSGVDYNHPDLPMAGSLYNLETKVEYGGPQGFNASASDIYSEEAKDPDDVTVAGAGHGTHVAGSIAAKWDQYSQSSDKGISGAASKCYILPVRLASDSGNYAYSSYIKGTAYIIKAKQSGVNIKVANNSWGGQTTSDIINENVTKTGEAGIITLFASHNFSKNTDIDSYTSASLKDNPYAIVVDSTNAKGYKSNFSDYGVRTTDVCAPGTDIMSTVPTSSSLNLRSSDTRVLSQGTDYIMIDDFENGSTTKLNYYKNFKCTESAEIVGDTQNPKGYESSHALYSNLDDLDQYVFITGDLSNYVKGSEGSINNLTFLFNCEGTENDNDNKVETYIFDLKSSNPSSIAGVASSTTTSGYGSMSVPVSALTNLNDVKLAIGIKYFDTNLTQTKKNAFIDNVAMAHVDMPYAMKSGTSMACPAASGATAVVANKFKDESIQKIVARIKGGTNRKSWLADYCYTGGIVDEQRACDSNPDANLDPVVTGAKLISSNNGAPVVELTGYFLGGNTSTVTINGQNATSVVSSKSGDMDVLTCTFSSPITGEYKITVTKNGKSLTRYYDLGDSSNLLETLPLPDKSNTEFDDYYQAQVAYIIAVNDNVLALNMYRDSGNSFYTYNFNDKKWTKSKFNENVKAKLKDDETYSVDKYEKNIAYCKVNSSANKTVGICRYDVEADEVVDVKYFSDPFDSATLLIVQNDTAYFRVAKTSQTTVTHDIWAYSYTDDTTSQVNTDLICGTNPIAYKVADDHYVFIDNGNYGIIKDAPFIADVYDAYITENGLSVTKLSLTAYPSQAAAFTQSNFTGYAVYDGKIIMSGPAVFDTSKVNAADTTAAYVNAADTTAAYVVADSYSMDISTGQTIILENVMSHYKVFTQSSSINNDVLYTAASDNQTIKVYKRNLGSTPTPTPDPVTPDADSSAANYTAATGDTAPLAGILGMAVASASVVACVIVLVLRKRTWL